MIVISMGGSLLNPQEPDIAYARKIAGLLKKHAKRGIVVVTGGGKAARTYAEAVRKLSKNEHLADEAGVLSTRQNAYVLIAALGPKHAYSNVPNDFNEALKAALSGKIVVMGGTLPGITTDADAALAAEKLHAERVINLSNVDAVYDSDPRKNRKAKKFERLSFSQLQKLANKSDSRKAGTHFIFDSFASKIVSRSKIPVHFVNGRKLGEVEKAMLGKKHAGTVVG